MQQKPEYAVIIRESDDKEEDDYEAIIPCLAPHNWVFGDTRKEALHAASDLIDITVRNAVLQAERTGDWTVVEQLIPRLTPEEAERRSWGIRVDCHHVPLGDDIWALWQRVCAAAQKKEAGHER